MLESIHVLPGHSSCTSQKSEMDWLRRWWVQWCIAYLVKGLHATKWASRRSRGQAEIAWHERNNSVVAVLSWIGRPSDLATTSNSSCHSLSFEESSRTLLLFTLLTIPRTTATHFSPIPRACSLRSRSAALYRLYAPSKDISSA